MTDKVQLTEFFEHFLNERGIELSGQELLTFNFVDSAQLDSFEILSMIISLEATFGVKLTPEAMSDASNATVLGLIDTIVK